MRADSITFEKYRIKSFGPWSSSLGDGNNGMFAIPRNGVFLMCLVSDGLGWDHVSVSVREKDGESVERCPTWEELEFVKRTFFSEGETAVQLHVPVSKHINVHNYVLHLWRKQGFEYPLPPSAMV